MVSHQPVHVPPASGDLTGSSSRERASHSRGGSAATAASPAPSQGWHRASLPALRFPKSSLLGVPKLSLLGPAVEEPGAELPWSRCIPTGLCITDTRGLCPISSAQGSSSGDWAGVRGEELGGKPSACTARSSRRGSRRLRGPRPAGEAAKGVSNPLLKLRPTRLRQPAASCGTWPELVLLPCLREWRLQDMAHQTSSPPGERLPSGLPAYPSRSTNCGVRPSSPL